VKSISQLIGLTTVFGNIKNSLMFYVLIEEILKMSIITLLKGVIVSNDYDRLTKFTLLSRKFSYV